MIAEAVRFELSSNYYNFSGNVLELTLTNYKFVWFEIYK